METNLTKIILAFTVEFKIELSRSIMHGIETKVTSSRSL